MDKIEKFRESYLIFRDDEGWKLLHPDKGIHLLGIEGDLVDSLSFETAITCLTQDNSRVECSDADDVVEAKKDLINDGYTLKDINKMKLQVSNIARLQ